MKNVMEQRNEAKFVALKSDLVAENLKYCKLRHEIIGKGMMVVNMMVNFGKP